MKDKPKMPAEIKSLVSGILNKYDIDFDNLIKNQKSEDSKVETFYFTVKEAMLFSRLSRSSLSRLWKARKITVLKMTAASRSGKILINRASLIAYLQSLQLKY